MTRDTPALIERRGSGPSPSEALMEGRKVINLNGEEPTLRRMTSFIVAVPIRPKPMVVGGRVFGEEGWGPAL